MQEPHETIVVIVDDENKGVHFHKTTHTYTRLADTILLLQLQSGLEWFGDAAGRNPQF